MIHRGPFQPLPFCDSVTKVLDLAGVMGICRNKFELNSNPPKVLAKVKVHFLIITPSLSKIQAHYISFSFFF